MALNRKEAKKKIGSTTHAGVRMFFTLRLTNVQMYSVRIGPGVNGQLASVEAKVKRLKFTN